MSNTSDSPKLNTAFFSDALFTSAQNAYVNADLQQAEALCIEGLQKHPKEERFLCLLQGVRHDGLLLNISKEINSANENFNQLNANISQGYILDLLSQEAYKDPKRLEQHGFKIYSQNEEDGIIHEIFQRIGITNRIFIEIGVQNGIECNTLALLLQNWKGCWFDGGEHYINFILQHFHFLVEQGHLDARHAFVTAENINALIQELNYPSDIDLLSIDIDGNDYHVFNALDTIRPRVVVIEYNASFPPPIEFVMQYNPEFVWDGSNYFGSSLQSMTKMFNEKGYRLVSTNLSGANAFFVLEELAKNHFLEPATAKQLFNPARYQLALSWLAFPSGHRPDVGPWENMPMPSSK